MKQPRWRRALVTGASSGIGRAMAGQLAARGVEVIVVARRGQRLEELAGSIPGIEVLAADLTTTAGRDLVVGRLRDAPSPIDLLVNNAGFGTSGRFADIDADRSAAEIELNVQALVRLTHGALPGMLERGRGSVLNVSSIAGFQAVPDLAVYAATKAFVTSFTEALHGELAGTGVTATALCPGLTRTEFQAVSSNGSPASYPAIAWMTAEAVARSGLRAAAAGRTVIVPGVLNKVMAAAAGAAPRAVVRRVAGSVAKR